MARAQNRKAGAGACTGAGALSLLFLLFFAFLENSKVDYVILIIADRLSQTASDHEPLKLETQRQTK
jgi:hypothetical protein